MLAPLPPQRVGGLFLPRIVHIVAHINPSRGNPSCHVLKNRSSGKRCLKIAYEGRWGKGAFSSLPSQAVSALISGDLPLMDDALVARAVSADVSSAHVALDFG